MPSFSRAAVGLTALVLLLCACDRRNDHPPAGSAALAAAQVRIARILLPPPGVPMAAGYFELENPGATALVLETLESPAFESIQMHETIEQNGVSRMRSLASATVGPGQTMRFEPGGLHLMLMGPKLPANGAAASPITIKMRLRTAAGDEVRELDVPFTVEHRGDPSSHDAHTHHH